MKRLFIAASLLFLATHAEAEPCDAAPSGPPPLPTVSMDVNYIELSHLIHALEEAEHKWRKEHEKYRDTPEETMAAVSYRQIYRHRKLIERLQATDQSLRKIYYPNGTPHWN
jgi:hypothetical protein